MSEALIFDYLRHIIMLPYAVIGNDGKQHYSAPPRPIIWTSKQHIEVKGQEIVQPKPILIIEASNSSYPSQHRPGVEQQGPGGQRQSGGGHLIDACKSSLKGFKVGEINGSGSHLQFPNGLRMTESNVLPEFDPLAPDGRRVSNPSSEWVHPTHDNDPSSYHQYAIRMEGQEQPFNNPVVQSFTRRLINDIGNEETNALMPIKMRQEKEKEMAQHLVIQPREEPVQVNFVRNLGRELGMFRKDKNYTNEFVFTRKELRTLVGDQKRLQYTPTLGATVFRNLKSMHPQPTVEYEVIQQSRLDAGQQSRLEVGQQSRVSAGSHTSKRHPIFVNSKVEHFDESSKYPQDNSRASHASRGSAGSGAAIYSIDNQFHFKPSEQSEFYPQPRTQKRDLKGSRNRIPIFAHSPPDLPGRESSNIFDRDNKEITFAESHLMPESQAMPYLEESRRRRQANSHDVSGELGSSGRQSSNNNNGLNRKLIVEGVEQRNLEQVQVVTHRRVLSRSSKVDGGPLQSRVEVKVEVKGFS